MAYSVINCRLQCGGDSEKGNLREACKKKRSVELEKRLECDISQQRQERLTGTRKDRTLYMGMSAYICVDAYMGDVSELKKSFYLCFF